MTGFCLLLVLTDDFHQLVFSFPKGKVWTDDHPGMKQDIISSSADQAADMRRIGIR